MPRTAPPRPPARPPANAEEGAERVQAAAVKLFDRADGTGADWRLLGLSLLLAGLRVLEKLPDDDRQKVAHRVLERVYPLTLPGPISTDAAASNSGPAGAEPSPSNTAGFKSPSPRPPR